MGWKITIDGKSMLLDELSADDFSAIAEGHANHTNWLRIYQAPAAHPGAFYDLLVRCAAHMRVAAPERPTTVRDSVKLLDYLDPVDEDDLPKEFGASGLPLGAVDDPATSTSPTSTAPEDGTPSEPGAQA